MGFKLQPIGAAEGAAGGAATAAAWAAAQPAWRQSDTPTLPKVPILALESRA